MVKNKFKTYLLSGIISVVCFLVIVGVINIVVDPYFHFHKPNDNFCYVLYNERLQNDGIYRNFDYDTLIIGSSMVGNILTSEVDALFGTNSIKTGFSGATFKELNYNLEKAIKYNSKLKFVIRAIDSRFILQDKDLMHYNEFPEYLYDDNILNDCNYIFNIQTLKTSFNIIKHGLRGERGITSFDYYSNMSMQTKETYGKDVVLGNREEKRFGVVDELTDEKKQIVIDNMNQNVLNVVKQNPKIDFYVYLTPLSIVQWDCFNQCGESKTQIAAQKLAIEMMLDYNNIKVFSFYNETDMICNLNNYKDWGHYSPEVSSYILKCMKNNNCLITKSNYQNFFVEMENFYYNYDYDALYAERE